MELQLRPDARKYSHARLEKSDWILVVPVKKIVDAPKHGQLPAESETRREIHRRIPGRVEAWDRKVAVAVYPATDRENAGVQQQPVRRLPGRVQVAFVLRATQQPLVQQVVGRLRMGVVQPQDQLLYRLVRPETLAPVGARAPDVGVSGPRDVGRYQVANAIVEPGGPDPDPAPAEPLFDAEIVSHAGFGPQLRVREEERRKALEQLTQRRGLESSTDAGLEFRARCRAHPGRCDSVGHLAAKAIVVVVARVEGREPVRAELRLQFHVSRCDAGARGDRRADLIARILQTEQHRVRTRDSDGALPVNFEALAGIGTLRNLRLQSSRLVASVGDTQRLIKATIQRHEMRAGTPVVLVGVTGALLCCRESGKGAEVLAGIAQVGVGIARDQAQVEVRREIESQLAGDREVVVVVVDAMLTRRQHVKRGDRRCAGVQVGYIRTVMKGALRSADSGGLVKAGEGAVWNRRRQLYPPYH